MFAVWHSRRHAAEVCAGGAWQVQKSPGGNEDCRVGRLTPGLRRPGQTREDYETYQKPEIEVLGIKCISSLYNENITLRRSASAKLKPYLHYSRYTHFSMFINDKTLMKMLKHICIILCHLVARDQQFFI